MFCIGFLNTICEAESGDDYIGFFIGMGIIVVVLIAMLYYLKQFGDRVRMLVSQGTYLPDFWLGD